VRRDATPPACELMADVNDAGGEVNVVPAEAEHLGEPHACVGAGEEQRPVSSRASGEEPGELRLREDALVGAQGMRPLVALEPLEGMRGDVAAAQREREDAAERPEDPLDRPGRQTGRLQLARNGDDIVGCDQHQAAPAEPGQ